MGWSLGFDSTWNRDVGYGVPAHCDHPGCMKEIDRGLEYTCGGDMYGGEHGCGLHFCSAHRCYAGDRRDNASLCQRCYRGRRPFAPAPEHIKWVEHKLSHRSWAGWRKDNPDEVMKLRQRWLEVKKLSEPPPDILSNITIPDGYVLVGPGSAHCPSGLPQIHQNTLRRVFSLAAALEHERRWKNNP